MKKIITLLGTSIIIAIPSALVIACGSDNTPKPTINDDDQNQPNEITTSLTDVKDSLSAIALSSYINVVTNEDPMSFDQNLLDNIGKITAGSYPSPADVAHFNPTYKIKNRDGKSDAWDIEVTLTDQAQKTATANIEVEKGTPTADEKSVHDYANQLRLISITETATSPIAAQLSQDFSAAALNGKFSEVWGKVPDKPSSDMVVTYTIPEIALESTGFIIVTITKSDVSTQVKIPVELSATPTSISLLKNAGIDWAEFTKIYQGSTVKLTKAEGIKHITTIFNGNDKAIKIFKDFINKQSSWADAYHLFKFNSSSLNESSLGMGALGLKLSRYGALASDEDKKVMLKRKLWGGRVEMKTIAQTIIDKFSGKDLDFQTFIQKIVTIDPNNKQFVVNKGYDFMWKTAKDAMGGEETVAHIIAKIGYTFVSNSNN